MTRRTTVPRGLTPQPTAPATRSAPSTRARRARTVRVALVWQLAAGVLMVIATTLKRGVSYHDSWSISPSLALISVTVVDDSVLPSAAYVSRATVADSPLAPDTTYTFSYAIVMRAGERAWFGSGSTAVTVGPDGSLAPATGSAPSTSRAYGRRA